MIDTTAFVTDDPIADATNRDQPWMAVLEMRHSTIAFIARQPGRARCAFCGIRRVLYRIAVRTVNHQPEFTEARCATCWGVRADEA